MNANSRTHSDMLAAMGAWGLPVEPHWRTCRGIDEVIAFCGDGETRRTRGFDTDGVVVVDDLGPAGALGATAKIPRWATEFKFPAERRTDRSRTDRGDVGARARDPYAVLTPVSLAGTTVSMATLHNAEDVARKDLREVRSGAGRKGATSFRRSVKPIVPHPEGRRAGNRADADGLPGLRQPASP